MPTSASFYVYVDTDTSGNYVTDITPFFVKLNWQNGFSAPFDPICRDSTATILLRNDSYKFSPESASAISGLTKGARVRIMSAAASAGGSPFYTGKVDRIVPAPNSQGTRLSTIYCTSWITESQNAMAYVPIQIDQTADQVLAAIIQNGAVYPPGMVSRWQLGITGYSELDTHTYLGSFTDFLISDTGVSTFGYIGDTWSGGVSVPGAAREVCGREYGRLFLDRNGILNFWNRQHLILSTSSNSAYSDSDIFGLEYSWGDEVINSIRIHARPRKVGQSIEILSRLDKATKIDTSASIGISFNYADLTLSGAKIGGMNIITPVANTDFTANSASDGTGTDYTSFVTPVVAETATRATVNFFSTAPTQIWIQTGATIRGTAIRDFGQIDYTSENLTSQSTYGYRPFTYAFEVDNISDAQAIADYISISRATARGMSKSITLMPMSNPNTLIAAAYANVIGTRITLTETQTKMSKDYFIIGEKHTFTQMPNSADWTVSYLLEPADANKFWVLGVSGFSELDTNTTLGPL